MDSDILLLDDDMAFLNGMTRQFSSMGYRCIKAICLEDALQALPNHPQVDCALVDLNLGGQSGIDALEALHRAKPGLKIVMLSGYWSTHATVAAMRAGAAGCIGKTTPIPQILGELFGSPAPFDDVPVPTLDYVEWDHIQRVLRDCGGSVSQAARQLNLHRQSLQRKLRRGAPPR